LLVAGALIDRVALRALGLEDLLARLGVPGGSLRERRHRRKQRSESEPTEEKRRRPTATYGVPFGLAPNSQGPGCSIDQAWRSSGHGSTELPLRRAEGRGVEKE
jgi:hypothetical protein